MPTNRTRRTRNITKTPLLDYVRILLMDGHQARHEAVMVEIAKPGRVRLTGKCEAFRMQKGPDINGRDRMLEAWEIHRDEILKIWKAEGRKGKPWGAKIYE